MQTTLQDLHISHERNESENIPILVEERGDAFRGIPKLSCLGVLEYYLGVPRASPSLGSCHSLFLHPSWSYSKLENFSTQNSTKTFVRSVSITIKSQTLGTVMNPFIFYYFIITTVFQLLHDLYPPIQSIDSSKQANYATKTESV